MKYFFLIILSLFLLNNSFSYIMDTTNKITINLQLQNNKDNIILYFNHLSILNKRNKRKKEKQIKTYIVMTENYINLYWLNKSHNYKILRITKIFVDNKILYHLLLFDFKNNEAIKMMSNPEKNLIILEFKNQKITILLY